MMDRKIEVKVRGYHISCDYIVAGVQHEGNVTNLRIDFDEGWDNYTKTVVFFDAHGENSVKRILTIDMNEDIVNMSRTYNCKIPAEAMTYEGMMTFVVEGYYDGKRQRAVSTQLEVLPSPITDDAGEPVDPTPSQAEQLQAQIENLVSDVRAEADRAEQAAETAAEEAMERVGEVAEQAAYDASIKAIENTEPTLQEYVRKAEEAADKAEEVAIGHHAFSHRAGGTDPLTPEAIGAAEIEYVNNQLATKSPKIMVVTITGNDTDGYTSDKTVAEIKAHIDAGGDVIARRGNITMQLRAITSSMVRFEGAWDSNGYQLVLGNIGNETLVTYTTKSFAASEYVEQAIENHQTQIDTLSDEVDKKYSFAIGDYIYTDRFPDFDVFLECNGASLDVNEYPELYSVIGTKYGHAGDVLQWITSYATGKCVSVKMNDGSTVIEYWDSDESGTMRETFDANGIQTSLYEVSSGTVSNTSYFNTMVCLPDGDVVAQKSGAGSLVRISNISDSSNVTVTDIAGLTFGHFRSYTEYECSAQIVYNDANGKYYILTPTYDAYKSDGSTYWDEVYDLYTTTDFSTFTKIVTEFADGGGKTLNCINGKIFLLPFGHRNFSNGNVYLLENNALVEQTQMRYLQYLTYANGYYYGTYNYNWTNTESGIYVAGEDLMFTQLYAGTNWGTIFYGNTAGDGGFMAFVKPCEGTNNICIASWYEVGTSSDRTRLSVFEVKDDGTLELKNTLFEPDNADDSSVPAMLETHGKLVFFLHDEALKYCHLLPTHFSVPKRYQAYGNSVSNSALIQNPTPYIKAKEVAV